ncbi:MAG TPA: hypothetical protein VGC15_15700 [Acetobacteraceae bacterium]
MSTEAHHGRALIEEARLALDAVHRAALVADAGGLRRGLGVADTLLQQTEQAGLGSEADAAIAAVRRDIATALTDLDAGELVGMETVIETARTKLNAV